jgi:hypothetical protein
MRKLNPLVATRSNGYETVSRELNIMNKEQIQAELKKQFVSGTTDQFQQLLTHGLGRCEIEATDSLACSLHWIEYESSVLAQLADNELREFSDRLASRLTYLLEPICTIEADPDVVQMRSQPPSCNAEDRSRSYFELLARSGRLRLVRYHKPVGEPRRETPMHLTHEVVARLFVDFDLAAGAVQAGEGR